MFIRLNELGILDDFDREMERRDQIEDLGFSYGGDGYYQNDISDYSDGDSDGDWGWVFKSYREQEILHQNR